MLRKALNRLLADRRPAPSRLVRRPGRRPHGGEPFPLLHDLGRAAATPTAAKRNTPEGANIPQFVTIDLGAKLVSTTPASGENRSTPLESVRREGGLIVLQGLQNGRAFSFVIGEKSGRASVAIAREELVLAVSAACTPLPASR